MAVEPVISPFMQIVSPELRCFAVHSDGREIELLLLIVFELLRTEDIMCLPVP